MVPWRWRIHWYLINSKWALLIPIRLIQEQRLNMNCQWILNLICPFMISRAVWLLIFPRGSSLPVIMKQSGMPLSTAVVYILSKYRHMIRIGKTTLNPCKKLCCTCSLGSFRVTFKALTNMWYPSKDTAGTLPTASFWQLQRSLRAFLHTLF